jgi:hypothetical protein
MCQTHKHKVDWQLHIASPHVLRTVARACVPPIIEHALEGRRNYFES